MCVLRQWEKNVAAMRKLTQEEHAAHRQEAELRIETGTLDLNIILSAYNKCQESQYLGLSKCRENVKC